MEFKVSIDDEVLKSVFRDIIEKNIERVENVFKKEFEKINERLEKIEEKVDELEKCKKKHIKKIEKLENDLETKVKESEEKVEEMLKSLLEKISKKISEHFQKFEDERLVNIESQLKLLIREIESLKNDKNSQLEKEKEKLQKEKISLETKLENKDFEIKDLKANIETLQNEINNKNSEVSKLTSEIDTLKIEKENKTKENDDLNNKIKEQNKTIQDLEQNIENLNNIVNEYKKSLEELEGLKEYKEAFEDEKLQNLLNAILNNEALLKFREENNILDKSPKSILNLVKFLKDDRTFVLSVYDYIVKYKKEHQNEMSDAEIEFYNAVNNYFDEEIFYNIYKQVKEDKFDKSIHKGIGGETRAELSDDKLVLVPPSKVDSLKMRVKVK